MKKIKRENMDKLSYNIHDYSPQNPTFWINDQI